MIVSVNRLPAVNKPRTYTVIFIPRKSIHCVKKFEVSSMLREREREKLDFTYLLATGASSGGG